MTNLSTIKQPPKLTFDLSEADELVNQVEAALRYETHPVAKGIISCIEFRTPSWKIIKDLKELIREDYSTMAMLLGISLVTEIENL